MVPGAISFPMLRQRFPDDREFAPDWKKALVGLTVSIGLILLFVGFMLFVIAALTEFTYQATAIPPDVLAMLGTTRETSYGLLAVGGGLVAIGYIARY